MYWLRLTGCRNSAWLPLCSSGQLWYCSGKKIHEGYIFVNLKLTVEKHIISRLWGKLEHTDHGVSRRNTNE